MLDLFRALVNEVCTVAEHVLSVGLHHFQNLAVSVETVEIQTQALAELLRSQNLQHLGF